MSEEFHKAQKLFKTKKEININTLHSDFTNKADVLISFLNNFVDVEKTDNATLLFLAYIAEYTRVDANLDQVLMNNLISLIDKKGDDFKKMTVEEIGLYYKELNHSRNLYK